MTISEANSLRCIIADESKVNAVSRKLSSGEYVVVICDYSSEHDVYLWSERDWHNLKSKLWSKKLRLGAALA